MRRAATHIFVAVIFLVLGAVLGSVWGRRVEPAEEAAWLRDKIGFENRRTPDLRAALEQQRRRFAAIRDEESTTLKNLRAGAPAPRFTAPENIGLRSGESSGTVSKILERGTFKNDLLNDDLLDKERLVELEHAVVAAQQKIDQDLEILMSAPPPLSHAALRNLAFVSASSVLLGSETMFLDTLPPEQRRRLVDSGFSLLDEIDTFGKVNAAMERIAPRGPVEKTPP